MTFRKWIAALLSLTILCTALAVAGQSAVACPPGCACHQGGPCTCPAGTCDNAMCTNSPAYSNAPDGSSSGFFPTTLPRFPGGQPGYPGPINRTPMPYPTTFPRPTLTPGMPMPTAYPHPSMGPGMPFPRPTLTPGMPIQYPGMPFPGMPTATPAPTMAPTPAPTETPMPTMAPTPMPTAEPTVTPVPTP